MYLASYNLIEMKVRGNNLNGVTLSLHETVGTLPCATILFSFSIILISEFCYCCLFGFPVVALFYLETAH